MKKVKPKFQCRSCTKIFEIDIPGPTHCIYCDCIYIDWLNWEEFIKSLGKYRGGPWVTLIDYINS